LLQKNGGLRTADAAKALGVTEETIRRDFEQLSLEGKLLRSHGGAARAEPQRQEPSTKDRKLQNRAAKERIAHAAIAHLEPGQTVFFDASTTVFQAVMLMPEQSQTVLTNSLEIAMTLSERPNVRTVMLGGNLLPDSLSCDGISNGQTLDTFRIDAAFVSCRGIDVERGLSEINEDQAG